MVAHGCNDDTDIKGIEVVWIELLARLRTFRARVGARINIRTKVLGTASCFRQYLTIRPKSRGEREKSDRT